MDLLKNLPSYNKENFSKFIQGACKQSSVKPYVRLKGDGPEEHPQKIVTDNETLLHKELEMLALRTKRKSLKRTRVSRGQHDQSKQARMDSESVAVVPSPVDRLDWQLLSESSADSDESMT